MCDTELAGAAIPQVAPVLTSSGARVLTVPRSAISRLTSLIPGHRHRQCARGGPSCYECAAYDRVFTAFRGGATRAEWKAMLTELADSSAATSTLAALAVRPDRDEVLDEMRLDPADRAAVELAADAAAAAYVPAEPTS